MESEPLVIVSDWQPIFHASESNQVVLYNPTNHALSIRHSSNFPQRFRPPCPYCKRQLPPGFELDSDYDPHENASSTPHSHASNYFQLLAIANETSSRPSTPPLSGRETPTQSTFPTENMAEGYFKAFFTEECKLGMGAYGSVFLCQHVLDGNHLGHFAVKKIAVGDSHKYLLNILREVRLLERLHHPNIITYHHAWLETCQFSSFGPRVPTLHVLMQWAEGGSLDDFIDVRQGRQTRHIHIHPLSASFFSDESAHISTTSLASPPSTPGTSNSNSDLLSRSARIRAFRAFQRAPQEEKDRIRSRLDMGSSRQAWTPVHLLSAEEIRSLFTDVVEGLKFLHNKSILHLDLKPGNVLLTWDEGRLVPRAMLSDFGTSRDMINSSGTRSGNTGTLEYTSPESLPSPQTGLLQQVNSKADMWSLGMILHKLLFFKLPYQYASGGDASGEAASPIAECEKMDQLEREIMSYPGFAFTPALTTAFEARRLPRSFLVLLESLLNTAPNARPSCDRVSTAIHEGKFDPLPQTTSSSTSSALLPIVRRHSNPEVQSQERPVEQMRADPVDEKSSLAELPPPPQVQQPTAWNRARARLISIRTLKSCILIFKVSSLCRACPPDGVRTSVWSILLLLAVFDTWFEDITTSVALGAVHILVLRLPGSCSTS